MFKKTTPEKTATAPSAEEIETALTQLRMPGALCYLDLIGTNAGVSADISFNQVRVSFGSGSVELALREAELDFGSSYEDPEWRWSDEANEASKTMLASTTRTRAQTEAASLLQSRGGETKGDVKIKAGFGPFSGEVSGARSGSDRRDAKRDSTRSSSETFVELDTHFRISRPFGRPNLKFNAAPFEDLVPLNGHFSRFPLFAYGDPTRCRPEDITVTLKLGMDQDSVSVRHAFAIKRASGPWADLAEDPSKKMLAELLISKFLVPLHEDQQLWPRERDDAD